MADLIDAEFPISLSDLGEGMIVRIHNRYPFIDRMQVIQIVKAFFEIIRRLLILGNRIHIDHLVRGMRLHFYLNQGDPNLPTVKVATKRTRAMIRGIFND